ncbi:unnamed protein product [Phytomonas sp. Hart1]|nr:unnamed protein product [Phytomonas sp. Hart1]|eukprot:CCW70005.1 unnamed protein product [Phytomonas sp. isolate Hart1]
MIALPKVLLMGLRKSGKSSIQKVVFDGMQPHESVNLPTTVQPTKRTVQSNDFVTFDVWDFPGQNDPFDEKNSANRYDVNQLLENCGVIVFVMDCRELVDDARVRLLDTICAAYRYSPDLCVEVFIHKVDALSEDHQVDLLVSLQRRVEEEVKQQLENTTPPKLNFNLTSIYDHSVFQAFSLVVQRLIKIKLPFINELLQMLNSNSNICLSYLFLSRSKIYIAVDERTRLKARTYDLCSDAIEVMVRMSQIYTSYNSKHDSNSAVPRRASHGDFTHSHELDDNDIRTRKEMVSTNCSFTKTVHLEEEEEEERIALLEHGARAVIQLNNDDNIYVRELPSSLTIVLMIKQKDMEYRALIDRNVDEFYKAAYNIFTSTHV